MAFVVEIKGETSDLDRALSDAQRQLETLDQTAKRVADDVVKGMNEGAEATAKLKKEAEEASSAFGDMRKSIEDATKGFTDFEHAANAIKRVVQDIAEMSDEWTSLGNRIRSVGADVGETSAAILKIADETRTGLEDTANMWQRLSVSLADTGVSQDRVLGLTKELSQVMATSGRSAQEAKFAMFELSHALAEGELHGRQYRALWMEMPQIMQIIQYDLGVTRAELDKMAKEGQLSGEVIVGALEHSKDSIEAGFAKTAPTLSQQWTVFKNDLTAAVGQMLQDSHVLEDITATFKNLSSAIKDVSSALHEVSSFKDKVTWLTDKLPTAPTPPTTPLGLQDKMNAYGEKLKDPFGIDTHFTQQEAQALSGVTPGSDQWYDRGKRITDMLSSMQGYYQGIADRSKELGNSLHSTEQQMLDFVRQAVQAGEEMKNAKGQTALWTEAVNFLNDPLIHVNGTLRSMADLWDDVQNAAGKAIDRMNPANVFFNTTLPNVARKLLGGQVDYANPDTGVMTTDTWGKSDKEIGDMIRSGKLGRSRGGGPAVRDTNWVQSMMSSFGAYLGSGVDIAQGGLQQASGGGIDFYDMAGTLDRLKQLHDLEAAKIQPGIHADAEGDLSLGGGLNGVITQVAQAMTDLVHEGLQWAGIDLWDPEKVKHTAEGLANMQRWNQELDGINSKAALSKKAEYEEFLTRTGSASGGISVAIHKFSDDAMNSAKVIERAFETAFDGIEKALINFVDTGKLELGDLAKQLEHLLLDLAFRQAVGGIGSLGGGGGALGSGLGFGALSDGIGDGGGIGGGASAAARAAPQQIHVHLGDEVMTAAVSRPAVQAAVTNIVYRQHGNVLSVRDRLRSRG